MGSWYIQSDKYYIELFIQYLYLTSLLRFSGKIVGRAVYTTRLYQELGKKDTIHIIDMRLLGYEALGKYSITTFFIKTYVPRTPGERIQYKNIVCIGMRTSWYTCLRFLLGAE